MDSFVTPGALGSEMGWGTLSAFAKSAEKVLMKYARFDTSWSVRLGQAGIEVYGMPRLMMFTRS